MKKFFAFIFLVKLLLVLFIANVYAAKGVASVYKVTMRKLELCTGSTGVDNCDGAVVIGSGDAQIDIAAATAGESAAQYGTTATLVLGTVYTHIRVTIDRMFLIKTDAIDTGESGNTDDCKSIATTNTMYGTTWAARKYTHVPVIAEGGTNATQHMFMPSDNYSLCLTTTCASTDDDRDMTYGTLYATAQEQHAEGDTTDDHMITYELSSPYTVSIQPPTVDVSFGTQEAAGAYEANNLCHMWAEEPVVTITMK